MIARAVRSEWPTVLAGFAIGFLIALGLVALWVMFTGGTEASFDVTGGDPHTTTGNRGVVTTTYGNISARLVTERKMVRPVRGDLTFRIGQLVWQDRGGPDFIRAADIRGRIDARAAQDGNVFLRGVAIRDADVYAEQNAGGDWNYKRAMARLLEGGDAGGAKRVFTVTDIAVQNTDVRVKTPERSFAILDVAAQIPRAELAGPNLPAPRATVARATGTLVVNDSSYRVALDNARLVFPTGRVDFEIDRMVTSETRVADLSGSWGGDLPGLGIRAAGTVEHVRFEDVRFLNPRIPKTGTAAFRFTVEPVSASLTMVQLADARLESQGSRVTGSATIHMGQETMSLEAVDARFDPLQLALVEELIGDTLPYQGTIVGTARGTNGLISFDVATRLTTAEVRQPFGTRLTGSGIFAAGGFEIRTLDAQLRDAPLAALRAVMPGLPLKGTITGRVSLNGPPNRAPLNLDVRLELASGVALLEGTVDLTSAVPSYNLTGRLLAVNLQQLLEPDVPPVFMTARFSVNGTGSDPNTANASVRLDGRFSGWRTGPRDTVAIVARLQNGTVHVQSGAMKLATMTASVSGEWRFVAPASGSIDYTMAFEPITPFGPYIPVIGDEDASGNIQVAGNIAGERGRMAISGDARAANIVVGAWSAASLAGKYRFVIGPPVPEIFFDGNARDVRTPTAGAYQTATAKVELQSPRFALEVKAEHTDAAGGLEIVADGRVPPTGAREVIVHRARIDFHEDNWALTGPAVISWGEPRSDLSVRGFEMRKSDGNGLFKVEGRLLPLADADFQIETIALPIGDIQQLLGRPPRIAGFLTTTTTIRATNGVPVIASRFQLDGAVIEGVQFTQVIGDASYQSQKLVANANAVADTAGALVLRADLPMSLRFGEGAGAKLLDAGPVNVTLVSDSIALAPFAAASHDLQELTGTLAANITITGTIQEPLLGGSFSVRNAAMRVVPLNQFFDSINATVALENRRAVIQQFVARSGGTMSASGSVAFEDLNKPELNLTVDLNRMRLMGVDNQTDAAASGQARLFGPLRAATLTGEITIEDGYVPIPQVGSGALDTQLAQFEEDLPRAGEGEVEAPFFSSLRIDNLRVVVAENVWFTMVDARAQLEGRLTINKNGDDLRLVGDLEGRRGTYTLRAGPIIRRFALVNAEIRFLGGRDINPAINLTARRRVVTSDDQMDIEVHIRGTMQSPTLSLASENAVAIPQSELLSFLLFGQPSFALGGGRILPGDAIIEETFVGGIGELLSLELEQGLVDELGMSLDVFQIKLGGGRLNDFGPALVLGEEIGNDLFLTLETGVGSLFGGGTTGAASIAIRLEWRINENTTLEMSYEPVVPNSVLRGYSVAMPVLKQGQSYQPALQLRRRWTW